MEKTTQGDLAAGLVVFLVALPLCLGIALASGAPLFAGVIAGIVGGIVVGSLSGSPISVTGPAAGLAVIVASAIQTLGSFPLFLLAVSLAGVIQIVFGMLSLGRVANYVPNSVIKGMLAAIGIVIILKQIPHALGRDKDFEGDLAFFEHTKENTLTDILHALTSYNGEAVLICGTGMAILLLWDREKVQRFRIAKAIPASLAVVVAGTLLNELFRAVFPNFHLSDPEHLVVLPAAANLGAFFQQFTIPDFAGLTDQRVYLAAATIAVVGSLETLLSIEAADKIDPYKRISPTNRELVAQGIGNLVSGMIGGLPLTSVVVRTSANVYAGGRTQLATISHGALLLIAVLFVPGLLNRIPLAALAAILIMIGYKLAKVDLFRQMYRSGLSQFLPFIVTVVAIIFTDLLKGVMVGFAVGIFFVVRANHHQAVTLVSQDNYYLLRLNKDATFVHKAMIKTLLRSIPQGATIIIDGTKALYVDHDIAEVVAEFRQSAHFRKIKVETKNFDHKLRSGVAVASAH